MSVLRNNKKFKPDTLVFYDLETTGLNPYHDNIIEIGAIKVYNDKIETFNSLVSFEGKIPSKISEITNIFDKDLVNKPNIEEVLESFLSFITNNNSDNIYLIAHNNDNFDKLFLQQNLSKLNIQTHKDIYYLDSLKLSQKILPDRKSYSLKSLCSHFDIRQETAHRAYEDSYNLFLLYKKLCAVLSMNTTHSYKYLLKNINYIYKYVYL